MEFSKNKSTKDIMKILMWKVIFTTLLAIGLTYLRTKMQKIKNFIKNHYSIFAYTIGLIVAGQQANCHMNKTKEKFNIVIEEQRSQIDSLKQANAYLNAINDTLFNTISTQTAQIKDISNQVLAVRWKVKTDTVYIMPELYSVKEDTNQEINATFVANNDYFTITNLLYFKRHDFERTAKAFFKFRMYPSVMTAILYFDINNVLKMNLRTDNPYLQFAAEDLIIDNTSFKAVVRSSEKKPYWMARSAPWLSYNIKPSYFLNDYSKKDVNVQLGLSLKNLFELTIDKTGLNAGIKYTGVIF